MRIVLFLPLIACLAEASEYLRKLGSSSSTSSVSRDEGQPMKIELAKNVAFQLGLVPLNASIPEERQVRKACIDKDNGYEFVYGDDFHLKPVGLDCYLELDYKNKRIECDDDYEDNDEDQVWLFVRSFDEDDDDFMLMGFDNGKARFIQFDEDYEFGIKLVKPKEAGRKSAQLFHIDDDDFFEETSDDTSDDSDTTSDD